jgi:hypothetical protein
LHQASDKKAQISASLRRFCESGPGGEDLLTSFKKIVKGFVADGEASEPLAAQFAKASGDLEELRVILRCFMHAKQRNLESAMKSDPKIARLIDLLVQRHSAGDGHFLGALARALKNSDRQRGKFSGKAVEELDALLKDMSGEAWKGPTAVPSGKHAVSSAPQRLRLALGTRRPRAPLWHNVIQWWDTCSGTLEFGVNLTQ